jgi:hypothetical protein
VGGVAAGAAWPLFTHLELRGVPAAADRQVRDGRVLAAEGALGVAAELDLAEAHAERVVGEEPADQGRPAYRIQAGMTTGDQTTSSSTVSNDC